MEIYFLFGLCRNIMKDFDFMSNRGLQRSHRFSVGFDFEKLRPLPITNYKLQ